MPVHARSDLYTRLARRIINKYPDDFGHIQPDDLIVVEDETSNQHRNVADIRLVPQIYQPLMPFKIVMCVHKVNFDTLHSNAKKMVLQHELKHIVEKASGGYKTKRHDVEDFSEMIKQFGLGWQKRKDLPDVLDPVLGDVVSKPKKKKKVKKTKKVLAEV